MARKKTLSLGALGMRYAHYPFGGGQTEVKSTSTLSKYQKPIAKQFGKYLESRIGQPQATYGGPMVAPIGGIEQQGLDILSQYLQGSPALYGETGNALARALSGAPSTNVNPAATTAFYKSAIEAPALERFYSDILPAVKEEYVGPGTYWSSARAKGAQEATRGQASDLLGQWAQLQYGDEQARRQLAESAAGRQQAAVPQAMAYGQQPLQQAAAALSLGALPRTIQQAEYQAAYQKWAAAQPENAKALDQALQFLGIPMIGLYGTQGGGDSTGSALLMAAAVAASIFTGNPAPAMMAAGSSATTSANVANIGGAGDSWLQFGTLAK